MDNKWYEGLERLVDSISSVAVKALDREIRDYLDKCGIFYKSFYRIKTGKSICAKLQRKFKEKGGSYKLQDLIGIRITVYFKDDISLCEEILKRHFAILDVSKSAEGMENFGPQRINYVCRLSDLYADDFPSILWEYPIDKSFEVQIRTVFSEGWHEIEHDFRYKCKEEWENSPDLSRTLNGFFATLDSCDWAIASLFNQMAYRHYKEEAWIPMLKNIFKIRIIDCGGMDAILQYFHENKDVAKQYYRLDREQFLLELSYMKGRIPLTMRNVVLVANQLQIHDSNIDKMTSISLKELCKKINIEEMV